MSVFHVLAAAIAAGVLASSAPPVEGERPARSAVSRTAWEEHHYSLTARVRPLALFWITRTDIGDAVVTRHREDGHAQYSLLIGSDPDRAPLRINRWGYLEEELHGSTARLVGLMTESEEESMKDAEAHVRQAKRGRSTFRVIQATAEGETAWSRVSSLTTRDEYTYRHVQTVLRLAQTASAGQSRIVRLPPDTRAGFLAAIADAMHMPSANPITYVYYGRLYELRRLRADYVPDARIAGVSYGPAIAAEFLITSTYDGEQTRFSMTYGARGRFEEVPLRATYQPRWWMQIELTIDDGPADVTTNGAMR